MERSLLEKIGLFDERFYPCYYEDHDMWMRMAKAGYSCANTADVCMSHIRGISTRQLSNLAEIKERNKRLFEEKWKCTQKKS
jgi:GT2 family glycosyltransferase